MEESVANTKQETKRKKMTIPCSTLEQLFLTVPKTEWPRLWRRVNLANGVEKKNDVFCKYLRGKNDASADNPNSMLNWDDAPSEEEDAAAPDILDIKMIRPAPLAIVAGPAQEEKEPQIIQVSVAAPEGPFLNQWLQFVADSLYVCKGAPPDGAAVISVSEHLLRWFSYMAAAPHIWEDEYPIAMKQTNAAVEERDAFDSLQKTDKVKNVKPGDSCAESLFSATRFEDRLQKYAERTRHLTGDSYKLFVAKRSGLSKVKPLLKVIFNVPQKIQQFALFLLNDRVKLIDERPHCYADSIALFDANDEAMAKRQGLRRTLKRKTSTGGQETSSSPPKKTKSNK